MHGWDTVETLLWDVANDDLCDRGPVRPTLVAFDAQRPVLLARCRAFDRDDGEAALTEVLAVMVPLGADRVTMLFSGRAWTTDGATPPWQDRTATAEVVVVTFTERVGSVVAQRGVLRTIERTRSGPPEISDTAVAIPVSGWIARTLAAGLCNGHDAVVDDETVIARAAHCITVGHELHLPDRSGMAATGRDDAMRVAHDAIGDRGARCAAMLPRARFDTRR